MMWISYKILHAKYIGAAMLDELTCKMNNNCDEGSKQIFEKLNKEFDKLNEYQKAAVLDHSRALLVNAHVGSGKTTVLINKIMYQHFVKGVALQSMTVLTFTNKAAQEIKDRIKNLNSHIKDEDMKFFGTFHSVARTMLTKVLPIEEIGFTKDFSVVDPEEALELYDRVINENKYTVKYRNKLHKRLEKLKQGSFLYANMKHDDDLQVFYAALKKAKVKSNVMEFDDLMEYSVQLLQQDSYHPEWVIIDEYQDCDQIQQNFIEVLCKDKAKLFAVGDPNQIIYSWRGSNKSAFENFKARYHAKELTLPINYRSTSNILNAAKALLENGSGLVGIRDAGQPIVIKKHYNTFNEALYLSETIQKLVETGLQYKDIAIFYRKQKQAEVFREVFINKNIPYEISIRKTLRDIPVLFWLVRLLKAAVNRSDRDSLRYVLRDNRYGLAMTDKQINKLFDDKTEPGIDAASLLNKTKDFEEWCRNQKTVSPQEIFEYFDMSLYLMPTSISFKEDSELVLNYLQEIWKYIEYRGSTIFEGIKDFMNTAALYGSQILNETVHKEQNSIKLMTLHASKGLEFSRVYISGANLGNIPMARNEEEQKEEQRLFFVGITRAKDYLEISYHTSPEDFGVYSVPSPFLRLIPEHLIQSEDYGSRASSLTALRKEIKHNIDSRKAETMEASAPKSDYQVSPTIFVHHEKYGEGRVIEEDEDNITVHFETHGEKTFSKLFSQLKYL
ncbi:MAG: UvrD/REP helicase [Clostridia bacterium]|jgi:DNA helicase-2/ATP-dependent DNA helicase PcrA|nr:UvrD/REP helicase [Clostridia bacterium]